MEDCMAYLSELRAQWRPLLAATLGLGSGFSLASLTTSTIAPSLGREFGWTGGDFALVGSLSIIVAFIFPFVGRLTDVIGVKRTALIGILTLPLAYLAYSMMTGDIRIYIAIFLVQACFCITTTSTVWSRVVVEYIKNARGLALAIVASGPAITGLLGTRPLNWVVETYGWRAGYQGLAVFSVTAGVGALLLLPRESRSRTEPTKAAGAAVQDRPRQAKKDYGMLVRHPAFSVCCSAICFRPST
jgi:MFS family permease